MDRDDVAIVKRVAVGVLSFAVFLVVLSSWVNIPQGTVGVVFNKARGGVRPAILGEGYHFRVPIVETVTEYPVALRTYSKIGAGEGTHPDHPEVVTLPTLGGQHIDQQISVTYHVQRERAAFVFDQFKGADIEDIEGDFLRRNIQSVATAVTGKYDLMDVLGPKKAEIQQKIQDGIKEKLEPYGFVLDQVNLGYAKPPEAIEQSLQLKMQAEQGADAAKYALQKAEMDAKSKIAQAEGEAKANSLVRQQLSPEFLKFRALEVQQKTVEKWDGKLPQTIMGGGIPLIDLRSSAGKGE